MDEGVRVNEAVCGVFVGVRMSVLLCVRKSGSGGHGYAGRTAIPGDKHA